MIYKWSVPDVLSDAFNIQIVGVDEVRYLNELGRLKKAIDDL